MVQEGLQLRLVRPLRGGEAVDDIYRIIEHNTRIPDMLLGDVAAPAERVVHQLFRADDVDTLDLLRGAAAQMSAMVLSASRWRPLVAAPERGAQRVGGK